MQELTQSRLKELLSYDPETGVFVWLAGQRVGKKAGSPSRECYLRIGINRKTYLSHRLAWLYVYGCFPINELDHINGARADNRICNLRECTQRENQFNVGIRRDNSSGFKGVSWDNQKSVWRARISIGASKNRRLGSYATAELASAAYQEMAAAMHGKFHRKPVPAALLGVTL